MSDTLFHVEASHSIYVNRLASKEVNQLNEFWLKYLKSMQGALVDYDSDMSNIELNNLISQVNEVITENMGDIGAQLALDLDEFAEYEAQFQAKAIAASTGQSMSLPAVEQVISAAKTNPVSMGKAGAVDLGGWLENISAKQKQYIEGEIKLGYTNGKTTAQMIRDIVGSKGNKYEDGTLELSRKDTASLVRTSVNHYATTARDLVYEKNDKVVIGYRIIATLDGKTSRECRGRDGMEIIYSETKKRPKSPFHPNCRTSDVPIIAGQPRNLNGQRASKGGEMVDGKLKPDPRPVNSGTDYYEFLSKQPAEFIDNVLGKTIGKAFRNSGVTPAQFQQYAVKAINKPMTIDNVKAMDKKLFDYIESLSKK